jgi:urease accessory protein
MTVVRSSSHGLLTVRLRRDTSRSRTVLAAHRQHFPLRTTVPMYLDDHDRGMAFIYVQNPTGAVFAGDRLDTDVEAEPGARVHVTTQSATKVGRMDGGHATQDLRFTVGAEAYVEYVPDPVIPQAGADLRQRTVIDIAPGGAFVGLETVAPGRRASGERFAYARVRLRTDIVRDAEDLAVDTIELRPVRRRPDRHGLLGGHDYLVSVVAAAPEHDAERLAADLDALLAADAGTTGAAGVLPHDAGVAARILAPDAPAARAAGRRAWTALRTALLGSAPPRPRK